MLPNRSLLEAALSYTAAGWPVFPCDPRIDPPDVDPKKKRSKAPMVPGADKGPDGKRIPRTGGLWRATTDPDQIRAWWTKRPDALIGVPTGRACGAFVVDFDPDEENGTLAEIEARLIAEVGAPRHKPGPVSRTQSGGLHLWYALPADTEIPPPRSGLHKADGDRLHGVDVRGEGGYVIVPPSVMANGASYAWLTAPAAVSLPEASPQLVDFVLQRGRWDRRKGPLAPPPAPAGAPRRAAPPPHPGRSDFFQRVNAAALQAIDAWAPRLLPSGRTEPGTGAWRVASRDLGRPLQEDLSIHPDGIRDFGAERTMTAIDVVLEHGGAADAVQAAFWLCEALGTTPEALGWRAVQALRKPSGPATPPGGSSASSAQPAHAAAGRHLPEEGGRGDFGGPPDREEDVDPRDLEFCARQDQSDTGNGARLWRYFGQDIMAVADIGPHLWAGTHWEPRGAREALQRLAQRVGQRIKLEPTVMERIGDEPPDDFEKRKTARRKFAVSSRNSQRLRNMVAEALAHITVAPDDLDADPLAINVRNGTLRPFKEAFREPDPDSPDDTPGAAVRYIEGRRWRVRLDAHRREDRFAKLMPVEYDPAAECPKWLAFMERFQPSESIRRFLQAFHGYALTGLVGEQAFVYHYGLGANGKSTFMEAISRLMGGYANSLPAEALTGDMQRRGDQATPEFARLPGARLVRCAELPRGQGFRESTLKMLTGGEPMLVRNLHQGFFEMRPTFKAIGSGNDRPNIGGVDNGIWRRVKLVPWEVTIPDREQLPMARI